MNPVYTFRCPSCRMPYVFQPVICNVCKEDTRKPDQPEPYDDGRVFNGYTSTNPENNGRGRDGY